MINKSLESLLRHPLSPDLLPPSCCPLPSCSNNTGLVLSPHMPWSLTPPCFCTGTMSFLCWNSFCFFTYKAPICFWSSDSKAFFLWSPILMFPRWLRCNSAGISTQFSLLQNNSLIVNSFVCMFVQPLGHEGLTTYWIRLPKTSIWDTLHIGWVTGRKLRIKSIQRKPLSKPQESRTKTFSIFFKDTLPFWTAGQPPSHIAWWTWAHCLDMRL